MEINVCACNVFTISNIFLYIFGGNKIHSVFKILKGITIPDTWHLFKEQSTFPQILLAKYFTEKIK